MQNQKKTDDNQIFQQERQKRSALFLGLGLAVQVGGVILLIAAFGPIRGAGLSTDTLELIVTYLGIIVAICGMFLCLSGTIGGVRYAHEKGRKIGYLLAMLGTIAEIIGFGWDNILHSTGHSHFDEAHNMTIGGLAVLLLASLFVLINSRFNRSANINLGPQN